MNKTSVRAAKPKGFPGIWRILCEGVLSAMLVFLYNTGSVTNMFHFIKKHSDIIKVVNGKVLYICSPYLFSTILVQDLNEIFAVFFLTFNYLNKSSVRNGSRSITRLQIKDLYCTFNFVLLNQLSIHMFSNLLNRTALWLSIF